MNPLVPLHANAHHGGLRPGPVLAGALVGFAIWFVVRWLASSRSRKRGGGV